MAKKRSDGEGNIRERENGSWRGEIMDGYTPDGKRNIVRFSGETKGEVRDKIREYRNGQAAVSGEIPGMLIIKARSSPLPIPVTGIP